MSLESLMFSYNVFRRLRWVGVVLFVIALPIPVLTLANAALHGGRWLWVLASVPCLGLSLTAFGTANDTAIHALRELARRGAVPPGGVEELKTERARRPARLEELHASPKASVILPFVAAAVVGWMHLNLWQAFSA